jgi:ATP synthase subunit 6
MYRLLCGSNSIGSVTSYFIKDPLEQFDLINFFNVNNAILLFFVILLFIVFLLYFLSFRNSRYNFYYINKFFYNFIQNLVVTKVEDRKEAIKYIPIFYFLFLFVLVSNFFGIVPFSYTVTSLIVLPFFLSITFFGGIILISIRKHRWTFFSGFLPSGVPSFIMPFLILIELLSYIMRIFSLAIRLFANMLSGHILIKILISVCWFLFSSFGFFWIFFVLLVIIVAMIFILESIICFLQAYVFVSLLCMYLNEALNFSKH